MMGVFSVLSSPLCSCGCGLWVCLLQLPKKSTQMCDVIVSTGGPVSVITMDKTYGLILAAISDLFK